MSRVTVLHSRMPPGRGETYLYFYLYLLYGQLLKPQQKPKEASNDEPNGLKYVGRSVINDYVVYSTYLILKKLIVIKRIYYYC